MAFTASALGDGVLPETAQIVLTLQPLDEESQLSPAYLTLSRSTRGWMRLGRKPKKSKADPLLKKSSEEI